MSATNRGAIRNERDFYATPMHAFTPLLQYLPKGVPIWEPAFGDERLVRWMLGYGLDAAGTDLRLGNDFLEDTTDRKCIVTNPPFSLAEEFAAHANLYSREVFLLLRLNFLGGQKRFQTLWRHHCPNALFVLSKRPSFTPDNKTDATDYAWFYWGDNHSGIEFLV